MLHKNWLHKNKVTNPECILNTHKIEWVTVWANSCPGACTACKRIHACTCTHMHACTCMHTHAHTQHSPSHTHTTHTHTTLILTLTLTHTHTQPIVYIDASVVHPGHINSWRPFSAIISIMLTWMNGKQHKKGSLVATIWYVFQQQYCSNV